MMASLLLTAVLTAQAPTIDLPHFLGAYLELDEKEIRDALGGRIVTKLLPSGDGREVAVFGIAKVAFPASFLEAQFREIETFKKSHAVPEVGRFGEPPSVSDLSGLTLPREDLADLRDCRVGDCKVRLTSTYIERLRSEVDWSRDDAPARAEALFKEMLVERARAYREGGTAALEAYQDKENVVPLRRDFGAILSDSSYLLDYVPELADYLERFPEVRLSGASDLFYWSKEEFGLKPVVNLTRSVLYRWRHSGGEEELIIASKQLYASHYFDSSLGLTALLEVEPDGEAGDGPERYLVYLNRSRSLDLGGFFGGLKRSVVGGKVLDGLRKNLLQTRARLEAIHRYESKREATPPSK